MLVTGSCRLVGWTKGSAFFPIAFAGVESVAGESALTALGAFRGEVERILIAIETESRMSRARLKVTGSGWVDDSTLQFVLWWAERS